MRQKGAKDVAGKIRQSQNPRTKCGEGFALVRVEDLRSWFSEWKLCSGVSAAKGVSEVYILVDPGSEDTTIQRCHRAGDADTEI